MKNRRKFICAILFAVLLLVGAVFAWPMLRGYAVRVPVVIGPYKKAGFILLGLALLLTSGFFLRPPTKRTVAAALLFSLGVLWFSARMILVYRAADSAALNLLDRWMPLGLVLLGGGFALWLGAFFPKLLTCLPKGRNVRLALALLLALIVLQPLLTGGFNWDDAFFSVKAQVMRLRGESVFARVWDEITEYVKLGRLNPFATFHYPVFYFIPNAFVYKIFLLLLTLADCCLFYRFLYEWQNDERLALGGIAAVCLCFGLRLYHDPLNSYYGLMQVLFAELILALFFFVKFLRSGRIAPRLLGLLFFVIGLMSYEMFFPLTALFLLLAWTERKHFGQALKACLPQILAAVFLFALSMYLRVRNITAETAYAGTTFGFDLPTILRTFANQVTAAFPLSYRLAYYDAGLFGVLIPWGTLFNTSFSEFLRGIAWQDLLAVCALTAVLRGGSAEKPRFSRMTLYFGLLLWLLPGLVISLSAKYQNELVPGLAYIPVYFSFFGAALILYELAAGLIRLTNGGAVMRGFITAAACVCLLIGLQDNRGIASDLSAIFAYPRQAGEYALQAGILDSEPADGELILSNRGFSLWEHGWQLEPYQSDFYSLNARREVNAMSVADYVKQRREVSEVTWIAPRNTNLVDYDGNAAGGFAKYGRVRQAVLDFDNECFATVLVTDLRIFVSGENLSGRQLVYRTKSGGMKIIPLCEARLLHETAHGALYKIEEPEPLDFDSVGILAY